MAQHTHQPAPEMDQRARIVALFAVLIDARHKSHFLRAAETQTELERAGVIVRFQQPDRQGVDHA